MIEHIGNLRIRLCVLIICILWALSGCSEKSGSGDEQESGEGSRSERRFLSIGTAPPGGAFFVVGSAIAEVVGTHSSARGWQITAEATKGTQENVRRLDKGEIEFALANAAITFFAVRGQAEWEKQHPVRTVMTLAPNIALFITPADSGVKTIADLKGKRVVVGPAGAGFEHFVGPILAAHGVTYDDFNPLYDTQTGAVALLADGSADAAFLGGAVPTASITQACATRDIHFIPFADDAMDRLTEQYRFFDRRTIPADTYRGQAEDFHGLNVGSMILVTSAQIDEETVYRFTKTLFEHAEEVAEKHPAGKAINPKNVMRDTGTPFHPGAIRYFREIDIWPEDNAAQ
ncbi:MAG: TAXI family TRAP transporter solute-binding subunit [Phycisphaerales bacterium]|nr:MAG: TAXI family TRAP transporter solute-binding subunit [Phycisphaerales bacterium]